MITPLFAALIGVLTAATTAALSFLLSRDTPLPTHIMRIVGMAVLCLLLGNGLALIVLAFATFLIGVLAVVVLVNATLYYALSLPTLHLFRNSTGLRRYVLPLVPALAISLVVPLVAWASFHSEQRRLTFNDIEHPLPDKLRIVQIEERTDTAGRLHPEFERSCALLCQRLLAEGYAERVHVVEAKSGLIYGVEYTLDPALDCGQRDYDPGKVATSLLVARAEGKCLQTRKIVEGRPDLSVILRNRKEEKKATGSWLYRIPKTSVLAVYRNTPTATEPLIIRSRLAADVLMPPLSFHPLDNANGMSVEWGPLRLPQVVNDFDLTEFMIERLARAKGIAPRTTRDPALASKLDRENLLRLLDEPTTDPLPQHIRGRVQNYVNATELSEQERDDFLVRVAADRRLVDIPGIFHQLARSPRAMERALPSLIERLESPPAADLKANDKSKTSYDFDRSTISYSLRNVPEERLATFANRIIALAEQNTESWTAGLIETVASLDPSRTDLIRLRLDPTLHNNVRDSAARAACRIGRPTDTALKDELLRVLSIEAGKRASDRIPLLVKALVRLGEKERAEAIVADPDKLKRVHRLKELEAGFDPKLCN